MKNSATLTHVVCVFSMPRLGWSGQTGETDRLRRRVQSTRSQQGKCAKHVHATVGSTAGREAPAGVRKGRAAGG
jgi:hypothetical protein